MENDPKTWLIKISQGIVSFGISRTFFLFLNQLGYYPEERIAEFLALSVPTTLWSAVTIMTAVLWWLLHKWTYGNQKLAERATELVPSFTGAPPPDTATADTKSKAVNRIFLPEPNWQTQGKNFIQVPVSPEEIARPFRDHTDIQARRMVEHYVGKWIGIEGTIYDISDLVFQITVHLNITSIEDPNLNLYFQAHWRDRLDTLRRNDVIRVLGKIEAVEYRSIRVKECELIGVAIEPSLTKDEAVPPARPKKGSVGSRKRLPKKPHRRTKDAAKGLRPSRRGR